MAAGRVDDTGSSTGIAKGLWQDSVELGAIILFG